MIHFLDELGVERAHLVGHSHGGRVSIALAADEADRVGRLLLVDPAGIPPKRGWRYRRRVAVAKLGRLIGKLGGAPGRRLQERMRARVASRDYLEASETMRGTFRAVIATDLTERLPRIRASTLLVWGERDEDTPLWMGQAHGGADPGRGPGGPRRSGPLQLRRLARPVRRRRPPLPDRAAARGGGAVTAAGLIAAAAGLLVHIAGRLHFMLHLFQLEHYERARLRVWVQRRNARVQVGALVLCLAAGIALTVADRDGCRRARAVARHGDRRRARRRRTSASCAGRRRSRSSSRPAPGGCSSSALAHPGARARRSPRSPSLAGAPGLGGSRHRHGCGRPRRGRDARAALRRRHRSSSPSRRSTTAASSSARERKLGEIAPLVIGITGSFGKTTTKACVAEVAELRGPGVRRRPPPTTPTSASSAPSTRASRRGTGTFIAEMGAYRRGDVAELCELVHPTIGILTAIGPAHLERFGSLDEIEKAKGELAEALPADGTFVTSADDERCLRAAERTEARVVLFSAAGAPDAELDGRRHRDGGGHDTLHAASGGAAQEVIVRSKLLGRHNVANLLAAAAVGTSLDLPLDAIGRALARVTPPAHRLAPILNRQAGIVVIDDAYNSNPVGAARGARGARAPTRRSAGSS